MPDQNQHATENDESQSRRGFGDTDSVAWSDIFDADGPTADSAGTDKNGDTEESELERERNARTNALDAVARASDLFVGISDSPEESLHTFVTELPQWFSQPETTEAKIRVGDDRIETDDFRQTSVPLTAEASTRTGTPVSMTVVDTSDGSDTDTAWFDPERELVEMLGSVITDAVDQRELDSLKRVSDGIVALDSGLCYTYVNPQAEEILERESDELRGEYIWDVYPGATDTVFQTKVERALETQSPTSTDGYYTQAERWLEARIYPNGDSILIAFTDITDSKVVEQDIERILETVPLGIVLLETDGTITRANGRAEALLGLSRSRMDGMAYDAPDWDIWDESGDSIPREDHPVTQVLTTGDSVQGFTHGITLPDGTERWLSSNVAPIKSGDGSIEQIVVALEDITAFKRTERLTDVFQAVNERLNCATDRREAEQTLCGSLVDTPEFQYARISEHIPGADLTESYIEHQPSTVSCDPGTELPRHAAAEIEPTRAAIESGNVQAVTSRQTDPQFASWREDTLDWGHQGGAIVPITYRDRTYGLLVVYTDRSEAFGDREQTLLQTLGDRIGQVFHSLEADSLIHGNEVVELTFQSTASESFIVSVSEALGCTIDIRDTIRTTDETLVHYASVEGASLGSLNELVESMDHTVTMRQIRQTENPPGGDVEIELHQRSLAQTLVTMGAVVKTDTVTNGQATVVCEIPLGHDIESLVNRLTDSFPETTLVAKRNYERSSEPEAQHAGQLMSEVFDEELTERQQQILRAAIYGGYFESPRRSTATEIADTLSLTQSTFSYHLRNAQQTLFQHLIG
ncbi:PAS domain-containing protein [Halovenus salina]|uniref:PAS domain-containing protein n=1 Tax=Halovenus salina TaxID=1510225 RepID=A0ABD5VX21_9EURY|nr:bacterio-opsin activator domain-containing protein [Halovenus salina]